MGETRDFPSGLGYTARQRGREAVARRSRGARDAAEDGSAAAANSSTNQLSRLPTPSPATSS